MIEECEQFLIEDCQYRCEKREEGEERERERERSEREGNLGGGGKAVNGQTEIATTTVKPYTATESATSADAAF